MTDLKTLHGAVARLPLITHGSNSSQKPSVGRLQTLILALAIQLDEGEILDHLVGLAILAKHQAQKKTVASQTESPDSIVH